MGWKLGLIVVPAVARDLADCVPPLYGPKARLSPEPIGVEAALDLSWRNDRRFVGFNDGDLLIFDFLLSADLLDNPDRAPDDCAAFQLVSTVNGYAFLLKHSGDVVRHRVGSADQGITKQTGRVLPSEISAVHACAVPPKREAALQLWMDPELYLPITDDEDDLFSHDALGEEVVFAVIGDIIGTRPDQSPNWLPNVRVQEVETGKSGWWPFG